jgi:hypothetical protein
MAVDSKVVVNRDPASDLEEPKDRGASRALEDVPAGVRQQLGSFGKTMRMVPTPLENGVASLPLHLRGGGVTEASDAGTHAPQRLVCFSAEGITTGK